MSPRATDFKPDQRNFMLFAGESGDGKSAAAASFPKPLFNADFDSRFDGVSNCLKQGWLKDEDKIEYQQFSPMGGWLPVEKFFSQFDMDRMAGSFKYKTMQIDSLTSLARLVLNFSHTFQKGNKVGEDGKGIIRMSGPADFNLEQTGVHQFFDHIRSYPCNIIVTAHIVPRWGRIKTDENPFPQSEITGEKLSVRDNLGANVLSYFNNVFRFSREQVGSDMRYFVEFSSSLAKNSFGIPPGRFDITKKEFWPFLGEIIERYKSK